MHSDAMEQHPLAQGESTAQTDETRYQILSAEVADLLQRTSAFASELTAAAPSGQISHVSLEEVDRSLSSLWAQLHTLLRRHKQPTLSVAVLALAKSGKSTFLNALVGAPLLPVNNIPETARICRITHTPLKAGEQPVLYDYSRSTDGDTVVGEVAIRQHLEHLNREVRTREHKLSDEVLLDIQVPIAALDIGHAALQEDVSFQLLDTPGPNESGEEALKFQVERLLDGVDSVLYLLDYTKLRTAEEASLFTRLKQINPQLVRRLSRRLFFVVNKMDTLRVSEGLDEEQTREYVAQLVTSQLADTSADFQLQPEQILLVSAQEAMLSRLILRDAAPQPDVLRRFKERAFGSSRAVQKRTFTAAELREAADEMAEESGMQEVEARVLGFLYSHAGALKLMAVLDDTARMLHQISNTAAVSEGALMKDMAALRDETAALQCQLEDTLSQFDIVQEQTADLEAEVVDEVRMRLDFLRERLVDQVAAVLDHSSSEQARPPPMGRWRGVWDKARAFMGRREAGAAKDELTTTLAELHADIFAQISSEVRSFWHDLETSANARQRTLLRRLNNHLEGLSRTIEGVVQDRLSIRLEPVDLRLTPPTAAQFHDSLQKLFEAGITQKEVVKERNREVTHTVWEKRYRNGLCRTGEFYVGRPSTRTIQESYTETVFELQPDKIKEYFVELIGDGIESSVRSVRAFVKQYLANTIESAKQGITVYAERFTNSMLSALSTSEQGEQARLAALEHVRHHRIGVSRLVAETANLSAQAEALFPAAAASLSHACSLEFDEGDLFVVGDGGAATVDDCDAALERAVRSSLAPAAEAPAAAEPAPSDVAVPSGDWLPIETDAGEAGAAAVTELGVAEPHTAEPAALALEMLVADANAAAVTAAARAAQDAMASDAASMTEGSAQADSPRSMHSSHAELEDAASSFGGSFHAASSFHADDSGSFVPQPAQAVAATPDADAPAAALEDSDTEEDVAAGAAAVEQLPPQPPSLSGCSITAAAAATGAHSFALPYNAEMASSAEDVTPPSSVSVMAGSAGFPMPSVCSFRSDEPSASFQSAPAGTAQESPRREMATIPLQQSGHTTPAAAPGSTAASSDGSGDDWNLVDEDAEEARRNLTYNY